MPNRGTIEAIERAKTYPFRRPVCSYVFTHDHEHLLEGHPDEWEHEVDLEGLTPVFGYSSNPSPVALAHKFASIPEVRIPVLACEVEGYDAVYSRHVSAGYIPATITESPGTKLKGFMTYLTEEELRVMNDSESRGVNYELQPLEGAAGVLTDDGTEIKDPLTYVSLHGVLEFDGQPRAVEGTVAENRQFEGLPQAEALDAVMSEVALEERRDQFIGTAIAILTQRKAWTAKLKESELSVSAGLHRG